MIAYLAKPTRKPKVPKPLKAKTKLKKESKRPISKLKREAWAVFAKWIKARDNNTCFTCDLKHVGAGMHAGHLIARSICGSQLYFDPDNVFAQCMRCNVWLHGNTLEYVRRYTERFGGQKLEDLLKKQKETRGTPFTREMLENIILTYSAQNMEQKGQLPKL